jgi:hypothetical protein
LRGWGEREGAEWVVREGVGAGGRKKIKKKETAFEWIGALLTLGVHMVNNLLTKDLLYVQDL